MLGAVNCLLIFCLSIRLFNLRTALIAGVFAALFGNMIVLESTLEPTVFVILFNLMVIYFLSANKDRSCPDSHLFKLAMASGFFSGLSIITKPSFLLFLPIGSIVYLSELRLSIKKRLIFAVTYFIMAIIVILPISVRNYVLLGDFVLVTADAGKVFFHGNGPGATALEWTFLDEGMAQETSGEPDYEHTLFRKTAERITGRTLLPSEASKFWFVRTFNHILDDPSSHLFLIVQKMIFFFSDYELHYIAPAYQDYKNTCQWPFIRYGWIVGFGLLGIFIALPDWRKNMPIYGVFSIYFVVCLIFLVQSRYRTPAMPYLFVFGAYAITNILQRVKDCKFISAVTLCLMALSFNFFSFLVFEKQIDRIDRHQTAVNIHYLMEARPLFEKKNF